MSPYFKIARWLNLASWIYIVVSLITLRTFPKYLDEIRLTFLMVPLFAIYLLFKSQGELRIGHLRGAFYGIPILFALQALREMNILDPIHLILPSLVWGAIFLRVLWVDARNEGIWGVAVIAAIGTLYGGSLTIELNRILDTSSPTRLESEVLGKSTTYSRQVGTTYYLGVSTFGFSKGKAEIKVSELDYYKAVKGKGISLSICSGGVGIRWICGHLPLVTPKRANASPVAAEPAISGNHLLLGNEAPNGEKVVEINPLEEFSYKTKNEIYEIRKKHVAEHEDLISGSYQPWDALFGQIVDKKPWWGIHGVYYYGDGPRSILGPAKESRLLSNPFLLVGMGEPNAFRTRFDPKPGKIVYPYPKELRWNARQSTATVKYSVQGYLSHLEEIAAEKSTRRSLQWYGYNARDFGLPYFSVASEKSSGIDFGSHANKIFSFLHFIHLGGSCGYPGGCNNVSPFQSELIFWIKSLPAKAVLKLWHQLPTSPEAPADFTYEIFMD